jgi:hypothetical protein
MSHALRVALVALPLALCACSASVTTDDGPGSDEADLISFNGLAPEALLGARDSLTALAGAPLEGATTALASSPDGQAVLTDLVRCALGAGAAVSFPRDGGPDLVLAGLLGLAPGWEDSPIGETDQRFVTACMMAHVNGRETPFPISVRSSRRDAPATEMLAFPAEEMAVYGNLFAPEGEMFACFGEAVAKSLGSSGGIGDSLGVPSYLDFRFCSFDQKCGFSLVGACFRFQGDVTTSSCETRSGTVYDSCHERPIQEAPTPSFNEAVTVYLQPADLALLLSEYTQVLCQAVGVCVDLDDLDLPELPDLPDLPL